MAAAVRVSRDALQPAAYAMRLFALSCGTTPSGHENPKISAVARIGIGCQIVIGSIGRIDDHVVPHARNGAHCKKLPHTVRRHARHGFVGREAGLKA